MCFSFQVFRTRLLFVPLLPYFKSKAGGYSTYIQGNIQRPTEDKTKIKPSRVRIRKCTCRWWGEEVGIIGKKGEKARPFLLYTCRYWIVCTIAYGTCRGWIARLEPIDACINGRHHKSVDRKRSALEDCTSTRRKKLNRFETTRSGNFE